jgi:hypothetical protein
LTATKDSEQDETQQPSLAALSAESFRSFILHLPFLRAVSLVPVRALGRSAETKMIIPALQVIACVTLAFFAIRWRLMYSARENAYRFLLPFIIAAGILGVILVCPYVTEVFVAYYSGVQYEMEAVLFRFHGPYWWVYCAGFILPLLPTCGLVPLIGKRPVLMAAIAVVALIPVSFMPIVSIIKRSSSRAEQDAPSDGDKHPV